MNPICFDGNKQDGEVKSGGGFLTSDVSDMEDEFGEPEVEPRVGDEFQAELPEYIGAPYRSQIVKKTGDSEIADNVPESFLFGLPLPLMWTHCGFDRSCGFESLEYVGGRKGHVICEGKNVGGFSNFKSSCRNDAEDIGSELGTELEPPRGRYLLPELLCGQTWTEVEYNSFLLGLYAFGKSLNFLKKFVGTKSMGDILFFYYGKFYKSKGYSRWAQCRKSKTRRCIFGQKIFTGWRQQELLSRLFSHVAKDCQTHLTEISKNFGEGKLPFEEYVFALKNAVGIEVLIAAVGIGKGKHDLTGTALEPPKINHTLPVRHEMPAGKACSSLTSADIMKILKGDFRLSKARSSDLFWEAVWPRLLANGWHSEEPKDNFVSVTKQTLVFLVPGVKKFSRRKLAKGNQYFDSISDVLNKVASDPRLLETEVQTNEGSSVNENIQNNGNQDGVSNTHQCPLFQSPSSKCKPDLVKFTIVDTSMAHDTDQHKVRQMKSLPFQPGNISTISSCSSSESETTTSEDSEDQVEQANPSQQAEDRVEQANPSQQAEDQVELANSTYHVKDPDEKINSSYRIEDQVKLANSLYRIEDQVEHANSSYRVEDYVEHANSSYRVEDHVEQANASNPIEGQVEQANASNPIEGQVEQANASNPIEGQVEHTNSSYHVEHANSYNQVEEISDKGACENLSGHTRNFDLNQDEHTEEMSEQTLIQKPTSDDCRKYFPCTEKMQQLRACNHGESSLSAKNTSMDRNFDLNEPFSQSDPLEASEGMDLSVGVETLSSPSYLAKGNPNMSNEGSVTMNPQVGEVSAENSENRMLIDLNFPQVAPDLTLETEIPSSKAIQQNDDQRAQTLSPSSSETTQHNAINEIPDLNKEHQPIIVNRRQSTRNRPLTTKALEALEYGFLNSKRKRKNSEPSDNNSKSQCLRPSNETIIGATCDDSIENSIADTSAKEENVIREYNFIV
ncbi:uncharacterized protein LOC131610849 [Vicia villosa]|uniref:uncharacterized protein LOC131610849 n=1 Tax=Vicia villosa TaxID=3911 RepID=UPI00273C32D2|nr:uncharacterized protein LOC131610849 [Vicia villosa]XP_058738885.1 uncharacterized protein LOC131610849 [Vicia villosa]XP_058738886.1 uncharacterized protein LOC131610849 [Vicia villosa]